MFHIFFVIIRQNPILIVFLFCPSETEVAQDDLNTEEDNNDLPPIPKQHPKRL